jgi:hypothetical protein
MGQHFRYLGVVLLSVKMKNIRNKQLYIVVYQYIKYFLNASGLNIYKIYYRIFWFSMIFNGM